MEIKIYCLNYKGDLLPLMEASAVTLRPEFYKVWKFYCKPLTGEAVIAAGRKMADAQVGSQFGTDTEANAVARGKFLMIETLESWDRQDDMGQPLPKTIENIGSLPPIVLKQFRQRVEAGRFPTEDEMEAMKLPLEPSAEAIKSPD